MEGNILLNGLHRIAGASANIKNKAKAYLLEIIGPVNSSSGVSSWDDLTNKPTEFPPESHTHVEVDITDLQAYLTDAPSDSKQYARKDGDWVEVVNGSGDMLKSIYDPSDKTKEVAFNDEVIHNTGNETVGGIKTFSSFPVTPSSAPSSEYEVANKKYVDDNLGGSNFALVMKTADTTINNNTVATDDPHLVVSFPSAGNYTVRGCLYGYERANSDFTFRLNFTGTLTSSRVMRLTAIAGATSLSTNVATANSNLAVDGSGTGMFSVFFEAILIVSTSGTFSIQWRQSTAVAEDTTLYAGSYFQWKKA